MSKHTTKPFIRAGYGNSHVSELSLTGGYAQTNPQDVGNWNKHKKRGIPSLLRTKGRYNRFCLRHANAPMSTQRVQELMRLPAKALRKLGLAGGS